MGGGYAAGLEVERSEGRDSDADYSYGYFGAGPGKVGYEIHWWDVIMTL